MSHLLTKQIELERWWADGHRAHGAARSERLRNSGRVSSDPSLRGLINSQALSLFKRATAEMLAPRSGNLSKSAVYVHRLLESMEGPALTHLIISAALNHLLGKDGGQATLASLNGTLVRAVEVELRIRYIEHVYPEQAKAHKASTGTWRHRNKALMTKVGRAGLPSFFASRRDKQILGMALVEMLLMCPRIFKPILVGWRGKSRIWCMRVQEPVVKQFNRSVSLDEYLSCVPPLGVYYEPMPVDRNYNPYPLARRPLVTKKWLSGHTTEEFPLPDCVTDKIQHLNNVGWRVNTRMLKWVEDNLEMMGRLGVLTPTEKKIRQATAADDYRRWHKAEPKRTRLFRTLRLANRLGDDTFYHDWFVDFRGRMYTADRFLSPQGDPLAKSLIEFSEPVRIERDSIELMEMWEYGWRMVKGKAKLRTHFKAELHGDICFAKGAMLDPTHLKDPKDYLPFVAWALEMVDIDVCLEKQGFAFTRLPIRRDATASSIQHMATMAGDKKLMAAVNLTDTEPDGIRDVYTELGANLDRPSLKSFVMTYLYYSTAYGRAKERIRLGADATLKELMAVDGQIQQALESDMEHVARLRDELLAEGQANDYRYTSPSGVRFDGTRYEWPTTRITIRYNSARMMIRLRTPDGQPDINTPKSNSGYVANVIHALDAAMIHLAENLPASVAFIHDCVVARPGEMDAACESLRVSFFRMHEKIHLDRGVAERFKIDYTKYIACSRYMFI